MRQMAMDAYNGGWQDCCGSISDRRDVIESDRTKEMISNLTCVMRNDAHGWMRLSTNG